MDLDSIAQMLLSSAAKRGISSEANELSSEFRQPSQGSVEDGCCGGSITDLVDNQPSELHAHQFVTYFGKVSSSGLSDTMKRLLSKAEIVTFGDLMATDWDLIKGMGSAKKNELLEFIGQSTGMFEGCFAGDGLTSKILHQKCLRPEFIWDCAGVLQNVNRSTSSQLLDAILSFDGSTCDDEAIAEALLQEDRPSGGEIRPEDVSVFDLPFVSHIAARKLVENGFSTLGDLYAADRDALERIKGFGRERVERLLSDVGASVAEGTFKQFFTGRKEVDSSGLSFLSETDRRKLAGVGISNIEELSSCSREQLLSIRGFGARRVDAISRALARQGKTLAEATNAFNFEQFVESFSEVECHVAETLMERCELSFDLELDKELFFLWVLPLVRFECISRFDEETPAVLVRHLELASRVQNAEIISLRIWLQQCVDDEKRTYLIKKFSGYSIDEICRDANVSRQRMYQVVESVLRARPPLKEDSLAHFVDRYEMTVDEFIEITGLTSLEFGYLREISATKAVSRLPLVEAVSDSEIDENMARAIQSLENSKFVELWGELVSPKRSELLEIVTRRNAQMAVGFQELYDSYCGALESVGVARNKACSIASARSMWGMLQRTNFAVFTRGEKVRYFDFDVDFLSDLVKELDLGRWTGREISANLLFKECHNVIARCGIQDEYELHWLLKKAAELNVEAMKSINFGRSPMLEISCVDVRSRQIEEMIEELSPISVKDFAAEYERRYGVKATSFLGSWIRDFSSYVKDDCFVPACREVSPQAIPIIESCLVTGWDSIADIRSRISNEIGASHSGTCNSRSLRSAGFVVNEECVFPPGTDETLFFRALLSGEIIDLSSFPMEITGNTQFRKELAKSLRSHEMIEISKTELASVFSLGITPYDCEEFVERVVDYMEGDVPFTIGSLEAHGFDLSVGSASLNDYALSSLLSSAAGGVIRRTTFQEVSFFSIQSGAFGFADVLAWAIDKYRLNTVSQVLETIRDKYGVDALPSIVRSYLHRMGRYSYDDGDLLIAAL